MQKTFRTLKPGDRIYQTIFEDSHVNKNALGGAEHEFVVREIEQLDFYKFKLTLNKLKIHPNGEFYEDSETKNRILVINVEGNLSIQMFEGKKKDDIGLAINNIFYSTTKKELKETLFNMVEKRREKAEKLKNYARQISVNLWISRMEISCINTTKEEEMEQEMDMEEAASMAL